MADSLECSLGTNPSGEVIRNSRDIEEYNQ